MEKSPSKVHQLMKKPVGIHRNQREKIVMWTIVYKVAMKGLILMINRRYGDLIRKSVCTLHNHIIL